MYERCEREISRTMCAAIHTPLAPNWAQREADDYGRPGENVCARRLAAQGHEGENSRRLSGQSYVHRSCLLATTGPSVFRELGLAKSPLPLLAQSPILCCHFPPVAAAAHSEVPCCLDIGILASLPPLNPTMQQRQSSLFKYLGFKQI